MYVLRKVRSFGVSPQTMSILYNSLVKSVLLFGMNVWYGSLSVKERSKIARIHKQAGKVSGTSDSLYNMYTENVVRKAMSISKNPTHPLNHRYTLLPSGKRFLVQTRTNRYKKTFIPSSHFGT